jgi:CO/xanthine dehydrogenase FAD-binding subunit
VKPVAFDYVRPGSLEEACALLAGDEDVRIIAGGQSLVPMLAMRLARPTRLVDILRLPGLSGIRRDGDAIVIGATTRQAEAEHHPLVADCLPLLACAFPWIGHQATRARGTMGGSIAQADPAAEIPLVAVTLGADITVRDADGETTMPAEEFFIGPMLTALPMGGLVVAIRMPVWSERRLGVGFEEINARRSDFAFVAAAAQIALDDAGRCIRCAIGVGGLGERPIRLEAAALRLIGTAASDNDITEAVDAETATLEASGDLHASAAFRRRSAGVLARRALAAARRQAAEVAP